jgi:hypothetical protein
MLMIEAEDSGEQTIVMLHRITRVSDFIPRPDFNNYKKKRKNKHDVSETGSVSVLR